MGLFQPEHENALRTFYGPDPSGYSSLLETLGRYLEAEVVPRSLEFDQKGEGGAIAGVRSGLFEHGLGSLALESGGEGGSAVPFGVYVLAMELAGAADAPTAMSVGVHNMVVEGVARFGTGPQRSSLLGDMASGKRLAAFALTEPSSGSDARSMSTRAERTGSGYVIDGSKTFITNAGEADVYLVFARMGDDRERHSAFLVDASTPGLSVGEDLPKLGMRGSRTAEVRFERCEVPSDRLLGEEGRGFEHAKAMLHGSRIVMGSICVGIALTAYRRALAYGAQRELFGRRLVDLPLARERVAEMRTEITAARMLCLHASRLKELGLDHASEAAQAKVLSAEMAARVCDRVIQLFGGYGYTDEDVHRHWRDARLLTIGEGASEVLRMLIAGREVGRER
jgi:alkylation response protein AidB-like acyl-CoA dehydrogenase